MDSGKFLMESYGRSGCIVYEEAGHTLKIYFEMSGVPQFDILVFYDSPTSWTIPAGKPFEGIEQIAIREKLVAWLKAQRIRSDL